MDKKTKVFLTVIADLILIGIIILSVYIVVTRYGSNLGNVFSWIIVLAIPTMFYFSYMTFAGDKYEYKEGMFDDEEEEDEEDTLKVADDGNFDDCQEEDIDEISQQ